MLMLKIEAGKATRVKVSADGSTAFNGKMTAGQSRSFQASNEFDVSAQRRRRAAAGTQRPNPGAHGTAGPSGKVTLTRSD